MKFIIILCIDLYMHVCLARNVNPEKNSLRIVGGRNATEDEFPYVVRLMRQSFKTHAPTYTFFCTGVVLTSKWTLTAAHCTTKIREKIYKKAVVGYHPSPKADVVFSEVLRAISHPSRDEELSTNDIGLLYTQPVLLAKFGKLSAIDFETLYGQEVTLVGYGQFHYQDMKIMPQLPQILEVIVKNCEDSIELSPKICFASSCSMRLQPGHRAMCGGDSGGPAVHASGVVSINSKSYYANCNEYRIKDPLRFRKNYTMYEPGFATPVSPFIGWVSYVINSDHSVA